MVIQIPSAIARSARPMHVAATASDPALASFDEAEGGSHGSQAY